MRLRYSFLLSMTTLTILSCALSSGDRPAGNGINPYPAVGSIPAPTGYRRVPAADDQFGAWLRRVGLKKDRTVYPYDGSPKRNQDAQFAVLDVSVGHKDLQQCADAVMRLRSEFLYSQKDYLHIDFYTGERVRLKGDRLVRYTLPGAGHPAMRCWSWMSQRTHRGTGSICWRKAICPPRTFISSITPPIQILVPGSGPIMPQASSRRRNTHSKPMSYERGLPYPAGSDARGAPARKCYLVFFLC